MARPFRVQRAVVVALALLLSSPLYAASDAEVAEIREQLRQLRESYEARLQAKKNSSEEVLHPRRSTHQFRTPNAIARARRRHVLVAIPRDPSRTHFRIGPQLGQLAYLLGRRRMLYAALRPSALEVGAYVAYTLAASVFLFGDVFRRVRRAPDAASVDRRVA